MCVHAYVIALRTLGLKGDYTKLGNVYTWVCNIS